MKILSIDVGIKNLAFCLLEYDKDIVIHKWNSINICEDEKKVCKEIKKKSKTACLKNAKYHKNGKFYCKIHAKNSKFFIPTVETNLILKKIKKKRISNKLLNQYMNTYLPESNIKNKEDKIKKLREHLENTYLENVEKKALKLKLLSPVNIEGDKKKGVTRLNWTIEFEVDDKDSDNNSTNQRPNQAINFRDEDDEAVEIIPNRRQRVDQSSNQEETSTKDLLQ